MSVQPEPTLVQLDPPGPHILATAQEFLGIVPAAGPSPARIRLRLEGGSELQIPTTERVLTALHTVLTLWVSGLYGPG
jgi:hypothetical protein